VISGSNGVANWPYLVLSSTNISPSAASWKVNSTNNFDGNGGFSFTNPANPVVPQQFFLLRLQ
jgi:hypothetical protein